MDVTTFQRKWNEASKNLNERAAAHTHFNDLCELLGVPKPVDIDQTGATYTFERGAYIAGGGKGWADVWMRGHFAWEYKGPNKSLDKAYSQLIGYKDALENPPLLIVSDMRTIRVYPNFTGFEPVPREFQLDSLHMEGELAALRDAWINPDAYRPQPVDTEITEVAAAEFSTIAQGLESRGMDSLETAHFLVQIVFSLFAEDVRILPSKLFSTVVEKTLGRPKVFQERITELFNAMKSGGELFLETIPYVNGGLFEQINVPLLTQDELTIVHNTSKHNWSKIEPAIFGTLFERALNPEQRGKLGTHFTSKSDIQKIVEPVVVRPLRRKFAEIVHMLGAVDMKAPEPPKMTKIQASNATLWIDNFLQEIRSLSVLDPACGSGNFLYVALLELLTLERDVQLYRSALTRTPLSQETGVQPSQLHGIEIIPYAQQLAQAAIWIGFLQWLTINKQSGISEPILSPLDAISQRDALVTEDGSINDGIAKWPRADIIIGNPPFLGSRLLRRDLTKDKVDHLHQVYDGIVPKGSDLVCYWFYRALEELKAGHCKRVGLIATNSIRGGVNRKSLDSIAEYGQIFNAWSDEPWILDGTRVRISIVCFDNGEEDEIRLNGLAVDRINTDLTADTNTTKAPKLQENRKIAFQGLIPVGSFEVSPEQALRLIQLPPNVNGRHNDEVIRPYRLGEDIADNRHDRFVIDFGEIATVEEAAEFEGPFELLEKLENEYRLKENAGEPRNDWWKFASPRPRFRKAIRGLERYIATPRVSKHRLFVYLNSNVLPDNMVVAFARDDDYFFGILNSLAHRVWSLHTGTSLEDRPRYTHTTTFETYPFPWPPGQEPTDDPIVQRIATAAKELDCKRNSWLSPEGATEEQLKKLTLTTLYNENPTWLRHMHAALDRAVWDAYGWPADETPAEVVEDVILGRLLALNLERAGDGGSNEV